MTYAPKRPHFTPRKPRERWDLLGRSSSGLYVWLERRTGAIAIVSAEAFWRGISPEPSAHHGHAPALR